jgi:hypothetical protein
MVVSTRASCAIVFRGFKRCASFKLNAFLVKGETDESGRNGDLSIYDTLKNMAIFREILNRT